MNEFEQYEEELVAKVKDSATEYDKAIEADAEREQRWKQRRIGKITSSMLPKLLDTNKNGTLKKAGIDYLLEYIYEMRIEHPYIVYAQALKESARFTSNIYKENHNLFGMKVPERRSTVVIGVNRGHAVYLDWKMSVIDYALFQEAYMRGLTEDEYLVRLGRIYASDTNYEKDLRKLLKEIR